MPIPSTKEELIAAIESSYKKLRQEFASIPPELAHLKQMEGHARNTVMSPNNQLAYLLGWGKLVLKWNQRRDKGQAVDFPETGFKWNELGQLAQKFYADYEADDLPALLKKLDKTVSELLQLVNSKSNTQLYKVAWYETWPLGRMIQLNSASPYANARARIRKWKKEQGLK